MLEGFRLRERGCSDNHTRGARGEEQLGVGRGADAAGCLQPGGGGGLGETADDIGPDPASAGAVQVDDVNQSCPRGCESP